LEQCVDILDSQRVPINSGERETRIVGKEPNQLYPYYGATAQVGWIDAYLFEEELVLLGEDGAPFLEPSKEKAYLIKCLSVNCHVAQNMGAGELHQG
jgi:type I restriction enzyme S subunit